MASNDDIARLPRLANWLLERFCRPELFEEIRGDLEEVYQDRLARMHPFWAGLLYLVEVVFLFRRPVRRRTVEQARGPMIQARGPILWKNYTKVALRAMRRHAIYTAINVSGLAFGIACCILIMAFVRHEWSYDTFHEKGDRLYRVVVSRKDPVGERTRSARVPAPLAPTLMEQYPGIVQTVRFMDHPAVVQYGEQVFREALLFTDASVLEMFSFPMLRGHPNEALAELNAVVLTASMAEKYFGTDDAMGKILRIGVDPDQPQDYLVTGVVADPPGHSSIDFDFLLRLEPHPDYQQMGEHWDSSFLITYVEVVDADVAEGFETRSLPFVEKYFAEWLRDGKDRGTLSQDEDAWQLHLQPLETIHLDSEIRGLIAASNPSYSYILSGIALMMLLIACINFVTLALARSVDRAKEVGVRKVLGALQAQVMRQLWGEAFLMSLLALLLGIGLAALFLPTFNTLAAKSLRLPVLWDGPVLLGLVGLVLMVGLVSGGYPALALARYRPAEVLKGQLEARRRHRWNRALVVVPFALSVALIVSTLIMTRQLDFMHTKDLGYDTEQVVVLPMLGGRQEAQQLREVFRQEAAQRDDLLYVSSANNAFSSRRRASTTLQVDQRPTRVYMYWIYYDFVEMMGLDLLDGRSFSRDFPADVDSALIVNEALQRAFGTQVGQRLNVWGMQLPIVGVVKDFHAFSLHETIEPALFILSEDERLRDLLVKVRPDNIPATLAFLEERWRQVVPDKPFDFVFLDESVQQQYEADARWGRIVRYAAFLTILISCLGLFGLTALSTTQRTKEVGIRKVLGASVGSLVALLSKQFVAMVLLAIVLAAPLAYLTMQRWLQDFAYRIDIGLDVFLLAGTAALAIALLAVGYHVVRAALANPAEVLRY